MRESLSKSMHYGQIVEVMYISNSGEITKRRIKVLKLYGDSFQAYCFLRKTKRTFKVNNVWALIPVERKESQVI